MINKYERRSRRIDRRKDRQARDALRTYMVKREKIPARNARLLMTRRANYMMK